MIKNNLVIILLLTICVSCNSKKKLVETSDYKEENIELRTKIDSLSNIERKVDSVFIVKTLPQNQNIQIENPCDTISKKLRKFKVQAGNSSIVSDGKTIQFNNECEESVKEYQSKLSEKTQEIRAYDLRNKELVKELEHYKNQSKVVVKWWSLPTFIITVVLLFFIWYVLKFQFKLKWL
jgi:preprotein translocase subunit SecD